MIDYGFYVKLLILAALLFIFIYYLIKQYIEKQKKHKRRKAFISSNMVAVDNMSGIDFEHYLEALFHKRGYHSIVTKGSHDFGADLIMKSDRKKIVIQAKRSKTKISVKAVMEIYAAKAYYRADEAYVFTNSYYTKSAKELAEATGVYLCDREDIIKMRNKIS